VLAFVGAGRKSEVYLAWDRRRRSTVAVKLLRPGLPVSKLRKEAVLLERLAHPVLVRGFGAALEGPTPHLVLEHVAGPSIRAVMRRGPMAPETVAAVGLQVATALHYLAMEGFVHLDVKPQNILLASPTPLHAAESGWCERRAKRDRGEPPTARLIDAAAIKPVGSRVKALGGAVPELGTPNTRAAPPAGVWLLGATMWRMLSGGGELSGEPAALPDHVPAPLVDLVRACAREDPSERPSAGEVADALAPLVVGLSPPPPPSAPPVPRASRLRGWLVGSGRL
jgi:serine/threonine protein kinase